jgi:hypothetical protein
LIVPDFLDCGKSGFSGVVEVLIDHELDLDDAMRDGYEILLSPRPGLMLAQMRKCVRRGQDEMAPRSRQISL